MTAPHKSKKARRQADGELSATRKAAIKESIRAHKAEKIRKRRRFSEEPLTESRPTEKPFSRKTPMERSKHHNSVKRMKMRAKLQLRMERKKIERLNPELKEERLRVNKVKTQETEREFDETVVEEENDEDWEELFGDDGFKKYFEGSKEPKVAVTATLPAKKGVYAFAQDFADMLGRSTARVYDRKVYHRLPDIIQECKENDLTHLVVFTGKTKVPDYMTVVYLPDGPTANFRITSTTLKSGMSGGTPLSTHVPEVVMSRFTTQLGKRTGRLLQSLFPTKQEHVGRMVVTFHNQRDFVFMRRYRYIFGPEGHRLDLQELGPRATLRLRWIQKGTWDNRFGEYEWVRQKYMCKKRRRVWL